MTYRALLTETNTNTTVQLVSYIKQWTASTQSLVVQSVRLGINTTCPVAIVDFNIPECPDAIYDRSTSPPPTVTDPIAPLPTDPLPGDNGGIIGGMVAGVFVLVIIVAAVIVIVLVGVRHRKTGSKDVQNNTRMLVMHVMLNNYLYIHCAYAYTQIMSYIMILHVQMFPGHAWLQSTV